MAAILPVIACCAVITIALGIFAVLGLSKKNKDPADQKETSRRLSDWRES